MSSKIGRVLAVVNPASANGTTGRAWPSISRRLEEAGIAHQAELTGAPGEATAITRQALSAGIISVGGDGTANEVVNGFFDGDNFLGGGARLGLICRGTGCDLIRTLGVPKAEGEAIEILRAGRTRRIDVGQARFTAHDGREAVRYFVNIGGLGLDGETVARVNRTTKVFGGFASFLWGTLATVATYRTKEAEVVIDGGQTLRGRFNTVVVANGRFFGGGMMIAPEAAMDDGLFDVVILGDIGRLELVRSIGQVYGGTHLDHPKISLARGREVTVRSEETMLLDLDGEQPGRAHAVFSVVPSRLDVIV